MFVHQMRTTLTKAVWYAIESERRRGGREAEGGGLLNRCRGQNLYRGFESPPLRQISPNCFQRKGLTRTSGPHL